MIIEFFGIPGCGKTYQANLYKQHLKLEGKRYLDISRSRGLPLWLKLCYKLADFAILILPKYRKQIAEYREVCYDCPSEPAFVPISLDYCIKDIVLYSLVYDVFGSSRRIILNDEGQLHKIIVLIVQYCCPIDEVMKIYLSHKRKIEIKHIKTSLDKAFNNIKQRNRNVCPMDKMDDNKMKEYMRKFETVCYEVDLINKSTI